MKKIKKIVTQGDVLFRRVDCVPPEATPQRDRGRIVVAHSESGHHHAIDASDVIRYEVGDPLVCYLQIDGAYADVVHHKAGPAAHEAVRLLGGTWEVRRQREIVPAGVRRVVD